MTDQPDYRLYLESKFEGLETLVNTQFDDVHDKLQKIEIQTTKTNNRVNHLEIDFLLHPTNCAATKIINSGSKIKKVSLIIGTIVAILSFMVMAVFSVLDYKNGASNKGTIEAVKGDIDNVIIPTYRGSVYHYSPNIVDTTYKGNPNLDKLVDKYIKESKK